VVDSILQSLTDLDFQVRKVWDLTWFLLFEDLTNFLCLGHCFKVNIKLKYLIQFFYTFLLSLKIRFSKSSTIWQKEWIFLSEILKLKP
jgi:hypothetical protein